MHAATRAIDPPWPPPLLFLSIVAAGQPKAAPLLPCSRRSTPSRPDHASSRSYHASSRSCPVIILNQVSTGASARDRSSAAGLVFRRPSSGPSASRRNRPPVAGLRRLRPIRPSLAGFRPCCWLSSHPSAAAASADCGCSSGSYCLPGDCKKNVYTVRLCHSSSLPGDL